MPGPQADGDLGELVAKRAGAPRPLGGRERDVVLASEGSARARVDADAIARAVDNLLRNAVEASPEGGRVDAVVRGGEEVHASWSSMAAPACPPERAAELFEPFFTTKPEGTGLGPGARPRGRKRARRVR